MFNNTDEDDYYDYRPNDMAKLWLSNNKKYREIISSNLELGETVESYRARCWEIARSWVHPKQD